jgi:hypothetical protein
MSQAADGQSIVHLEAVASHVRSACSWAFSGGLVASFGAIVSVLLTGACGSSLGAPRTGLATRSWVVQQSVHGRLLNLHLIRPVQPVDEDVVVLYASGDGGWFGAAVDMFKSIGAYGYPAVGFSSRAFMSTESHESIPSVRHLADDYREILTRARSALGLPASAPAVLTGWSRGAAFAVLVGGQPASQEDLLGVIAIGLPATENLSLSDDTDEDPPEGSSPAPLDRKRRVFRTYSWIDRIAPSRCTVIQASGDGYLPAAEAGRLFGPESPTKRFFAVTATNHRFSGGKDAFRLSLRDALDWVVAGENTR